MSDFDYANFAAAFAAENNGITERAQSAFRARVFMVALWAEAMSAVAQIRHATPGNPVELDELAACDGLMIRRDLTRWVYFQRLGDQVQFGTVGLYPGGMHYIDLPRPQRGAGLLRWRNAAASKHFSLPHNREARGVSKAKPLSVVEWPRGGQTVRMSGLSAGGWPAFGQTDALSGAQRRGMATGRPNGADERPQRRWMAGVWPNGCAEWSSASWNGHGARGGQTAARRTNRACGFVGAARILL